MKWEIWKSRYEEIVNRLGIDPVADQRAAEILNHLLPNPQIESLRSLIDGKECVVFGAGPSLSTHLELLKTEFSNKTLIAADGATSVVMKYHLPHIIVTDLDGNIEDQLEAWTKGSWLVVHAHGDNIETLERVIPKIKERVIGTTQTCARGKLFNFGGFTDGDRAAFMAFELGAKKIYLAGMDFSGEIGRYSGKKNLERKRIKLQICRELLLWLSQLGAPLYWIET